MQRKKNYIILFFFHRILRYIFARQKHSGRAGWICRPDGYSHY